MHFEVCLPETEKYGSDVSGFTVKVDSELVL